MKELDNQHHIHLLVVHSMLLFLHRHAYFSCIDLFLHSCKRCAENYTTPSRVDSDSWKTIRGQFISIIGANITCRCAKSLDGISPNAHLGDGLFDLILIRKTSRLQHLRHMMRLANRGDLVRKLLVYYNRCQSGWNALQILSTLLSLPFSLTKCCVTVVIVSNHLQVDCNTLPQCLIFNKTQYCLGEVLFIASKSCLFRNAFEDIILHTPTKVLLRSFVYNHCWFCLSCWPHIHNKDRHIIITNAKNGRAQGHGPHKYPTTQPPSCFFRTAPLPYIIVYPYDATLQM